MSEKNGKTGREADPELLAMSRMTRILAGLDADARFRVVCYLSRRYLPLPACDRPGRRPDDVGPPKASDR